MSPGLDRIHGCMVGDPHYAQVALCALLFSPFCLGHQIDFYRQIDVGQLDFAWARKYGGAWKIDGCFGVSTVKFTVDIDTQHKCSTAEKHPDAIRPRCYPPCHAHPGIRLPQD